MIDDRGALTLVDVAMTFFVLVALVALSPWYWHFIDMVVAEADPFSSILLRLILPVLFIALLLSIGISARRRGV